MNKLLHQLVIATLGLLSLSGCGEEPESVSAEPVMVTDSAGVEVVTIRAEAFGNLPLVSLDSATVVLGADESNPEALFGRVVDATLLSAGMIAVADRLGSRVLVFSPSGELVRTVGRRGEGPGEFRTLARIASKGDTLLAFDAGTWRISEFRPDGNLQGDVRLEPHPVSADKEFGRPGTDHVFVHWWRSGGLPEWGTSTGPIGDSLATVVDRVSPDGTTGIDSLRATPLAYAALSDEEYERLAEETSSSFALSAILPSPYEDRALVGLLEDGVVVGHSGDFEVRRFDSSGSLIRVLRAQRPRPLGTAFSQESLIEWSLLSVSDRALHRLGRSLATAVEVPDSLSHFTAIKGGDGGALWFAVPAAVEGWVEWLKFSADGAPHFRLRIPSGLEVLEFGREHVVALHRDQLEVETVRVYEIPNPDGMGDELDFT